ALLGEDRVIVTPVAGTTRDTIEETASIRGYPVTLTDTAGIRKSRGVVEEIGIQRSHQSIATSDLVLHVVDGSRPYSKADGKLYTTYATRPSIRVITKSDLTRKLNLPAELIAGDFLNVSSARGDGL